MYAFELLSKFESSSLVEELFKIPWLFEDIYLNQTIDDNEKLKRLIFIRNKYIKTLDDIKASYNSCDKVNLQKDNLLIFLPRIGDEDFIDCNVLNISENLDKIIQSISIKEFDDLFNFKNPCLGVEFSSRKDILGYKISEININKVGELRCAVALLYSLTNFSLDENERKFKQDAIINDLINMDNCYNSNSEKTYSLNEMYEILGIKREKKSVLDKVNDIRNGYLNNLDSFKVIINIIYDIQEIIYNDVSKELIENIYKDNLD